MTRRNNEPVQSSEPDAAAQLAAVDEELRAGRARLAELQDERRRVIDGGTQLPVADQVTRLTAIQREIDSVEQDLASLAVIRTSAQQRAQEAAKRAAERAFQQTVDTTEATFRAAADEAAGLDAWITEGVERFARLQEAMDWSTLRRAASAHPRLLEQLDRIDRRGRLSEELANRLQVREVLGTPGDFRGEARERLLGVSLEELVQGWTSKLIAVARAAVPAPAATPVEASDDDFARRLSGRAGGTAANEARGRLHPDTVRTNDNPTSDEDDQP